MKAAFQDSASAFPSSQLITLKDRGDAVFPSTGQESDPSAARILDAFTG